MDPIWYSCFQMNYALFQINISVQMARFFSSLKFITNPVVVEYYLVSHDWTRAHFFPSSQFLWSSGQFRRQYVGTDKACLLFSPISANVSHHVRPLYKSSQSHYQSIHSKPTYLQSNWINVETTPQLSFTTHFLQREHQGKVKRRRLLAVKCILLAKSGHSVTSSDDQKTVV